MPPKKNGKKRKFKKKTGMNGKLVKKLLKMPYPDTKNFEVIVTIPASTVSGSEIMNRMAIGTAENQRIGTDVNLSYLTLHMYYENGTVIGTAPVSFHWAICYCPNQVATTAYNQVFFNDTIEAIRNVPNFRRYKVLKSGYVLTDPAYNPSQMVVVNLNLQRKKTRYNVGIPVASADFDIGVLFLLVRANATTALVNAFCNYRVGYTDS